MGLFYYYCLSDYDRALNELSVARERTPNSANVLLSIGLVQRRQGKLEASIELLEQASKLDPLNEDIYANLARSFRSVRNFDEARAMFDRALTITPGDPEILVQKAETFLAQGDRETAARLTRDLSLPPTSPSFGTLFDLIVSQGRYDDAIAIISSLLAKEEELPRAFVAAGHAALGGLYRVKGDQTKAQSFSLQAERELKELRAEGQFVEGTLLQVEARLGHRAEVEELSAAILRRIEKDKFTTPHQLGVAKAYGILGDFERALPLLQHALTARYIEALTAASLRFDPEWDPVRNDPRFQKLANGQP